LNERPIREAQGGDMQIFAYDPALMFLALLALYSPLAALSSYLPIVGGFNQSDQVRLAFGLFANVAIFVLAAIWIGEPLLRLLGITTAALSVTGGIALLYAGIPMMRGLDDVVPEQAAAEMADTSGGSETWRTVLFTPLTFPLTVGGTSFGLIVAFASRGNGLLDEVRFYGGRPGLCRRDRHHGLRCRSPASPRLGADADDPVAHRRHPADGDCRDAACHGWHAAGRRHAARSPVCSEPRTLPTGSTFALIAIQDCDRRRDA
jgi:small neutral amino acid transporter SnatA (MarC family)